MIRHLLLILVILLPLGLAVYFFAKRGDSQTTIRRDTSPAPPALVQGNVSLVGTEGRRLFAVSLAKTAIGGKIEEYPARYYWCETFKKHADQSMDVDGLLVIANPAPIDAASRAALLELKPADDVLARHRRLLDAFETATGLKAAHAIVDGAEAIEEATGFKLSHAEIRVAPKANDSGARLVSDDARATLATGEIRTISTAGPFDFERGPLRITGDRLNADAKQLTIDRTISIRRTEAAASRPSDPGFVLTGGGPLVYLPEGEVIAKATVFDLLRLSGGTLDISGGVSVDWNGMTVTAAHMNGTLADRATTESRPATMGPFESIHFDGKVVARWHGLLLEADEATLRFTGANAFTITTAGRQSKIGWDTPKESLAPTASRGLTATCEGELVFDYRPAAAKNAPDPHLLMKKAVRLYGVLGGAAGVELFGDQLDFTLMHPDRATPGSRPALDFKRAELTGDAHGRVGPWLVRGQKLTHDRRFDKNGVLDADVVTMRGPQASLKSDAANLDESADRQEVTAEKSITIERAASPYGSSKMHAEGRAVVKSISPEGTDTLSGETLDATMSPATTDLATGKKTAARLAMVDAKGTAHFLDREGRSIDGDTLHVDMEPLHFDVTGKPAVVRGFFDGKTTAEKSEFKAEHVTYDRAKGRFHAERKVHARVPLGDIDLFTNPADRLGVGRRGNPFAERAPLQAEPWVIDCEDFEATQSGIIAGASFAETGRLTLRGGVMATNVRKSITADHLEYDLGLKHGVARGKPVHITARAGDTDEVEDDVKAGEITFDPASTYLKDHCDVVMHVPQGASIEATPAALSRPTTQYEKLHVVSSNDVLLSAGNVFFSGRTTMEQTSAKGDTSSMTADTGKITLEAGADGRASMNLGRVARIEGFGAVEFKNGSLVGRGDMITVVPAESKLTLVGTDKPCELQVGRETTRHPKQIKYNMKTGVMELLNGASGSR